MVDRVYELRHGSMEPERPYALFRVLQKMLNPSNNGRVWIKNFAAKEDAEAWVAMQRGRFIDG